MVYAATVSILCIDPVGMVNQHEKSPCRESKQATSATNHWLWRFHVSMECSLAILKWDCPTWLPFHGRRLAYTSKDYPLGSMGLVTIHAGKFTSHMDPLGFSVKTTPQRKLICPPKKGPFQTEISSSTPLEISGRSVSFRVCNYRNDTILAPT